MRTILSSVSRVLLILVLLPWGEVEAAPAFDAARAWTHLEAQCAFGPRVPGTEAHARCLAYLEEALRATGGEVALLPFQAPAPGRADSIEMTNLRARFGGSGAPLLLGAHWDTRAWADRDPDPSQRSRPVLGANDGASAVAVLLVLAEAFGRESPPHPVEIAFFDGEDQGREGDERSYCLGSQAYAGALGSRPRAVIILDLVGAKDLHICREEYSEANAPWLNDLLFSRARDMGLAGFEDRVCYGVFDDHVPFLERGIPAVDLVDMHYREWHTAGDTPGACSSESLRQLGDLLVGIVYGGTLR
jgi:hypothetical protein